MNRMRVGRRQRSELRGGELINTVKRRRRQRKSWMFEKLEERHYFSATPIAIGEVFSISSNTPEGLQAILERELAWAIAQSAVQQGANIGNLALHAAPNDPYFQYQWHLLNSGQLVGSPDYQDIFAKPGEDINVSGAWDLGYTGAGVVVAVLDSGTQLNHPDLAANIDPLLQFDAITGDSNASPDLLDPGNAHGTAVAGLIAAVGNNGIGTTGVAYNSQIVPIRLVDPLGPITDANIVEALLFSNQIIDIYNSSWGPADANSRLAYSLSALEAFALRNGIQTGRGGLGSIYVFSAGNDAGPIFSAGFTSIGDWDSAAYNGYVNSRYTIGVGGIDHDGSYNNIDGTVTNYMEAGPSILVAAPTGSFPITIANEIAVGSGIWTTDLTGDDGFNAAPLPNGAELDLTLDYFADTDYTSRFNGTSASAPIVSGVIALMLEANPNLTWRDVQEILVRSARQAGQFETPATGGGLTNLNSWSVNPHPFFHNPDPYTPALPAVPGDPGDPNADPPIPPTPDLPAVPADPFSEIFYPSPIVVSNVVGLGATGFLLNYDSYKPPRPEVFANGAGYTVSQGIGSYGEQYGYGHGVVDAELAVRLAEQWHTKDQALAPELTYTTFVRQPGTNIQAGTLTNAASGTILIPGGIGSVASVAYWNEYYDNTPFAPYNGPAGSARGGYLNFEIPDSNAMSVESIEVKLDLNSANVNAYDGLRITLVSPNGTVSELNHYSDSLVGGTRQNPVLSPLAYDPPGSISAGGNFIYTFNSNRNWGERYDIQPIIDPVTGNPFLDSLGQAVQHGWELHIENYSPAAVALTGLEITWHGAPIEASTQRIQGAVGIDGGRFGVGVDDGFFNFDRYFQTIADLDGDFDDIDGSRTRNFVDLNGNMMQDPDEPLEPQIVDFNEVIRTQDPFQELFAENVTVTATRVSDGAVVAQFVTGADGNFYFDLVPDEYIISVEDSLGRATKDESLLGGVPADRLAHYQHEWHITEDWFYVPQVDNSVDNDFRVMTDAAGTPVAFSTLVQPPLSSGVKNVNFLLEGSALADISGVVFADVTPAGTGDGVFNGNDVAAPGFIVYLDTNNSGQFELTDEYVTTGADGRYSLSVDLEDTSVVRLAAIPLNANWIATNPAGAVYSLLVSPGDILSEQNFAFRPTNGSGNAAGNTPGSILGVAFDDVNGDGVRQANELGISGLRVFHDLDSSGTWDANEPFAFTTDNGAYFLANITPGSVRLDIEISSALSLTTPVAGFRTVMLLSDGTVTNQLFGIRNQSNSDWGDLAGYPTLLVDNGPRHVVVPGFQLGAKIDMEMDGQPTANADGDDAVMGDEDGVVIVSNGGLLQPGANTVRVTVRGVGGYLNAWMDFNNDGDFTDPGEQIFADLHLNQGPNGTSLSHDLIVTAPAGMAGGPIAARFRWGNPGLSFVGPDTIGEVEDYRLANSLQPVLVFASGDFDQSGLVDHDDYVLWKATYGTSDLRADGNNDGQVNSADYTIWRNNMGAESYFGAGAATGAGSASTLAAGASVALANPSAARAAAFARALAVQNDISGGQHSEGDAVVAARLMAAGAVPMTVQVGNITQTVYYLPSQDGSAALPTGWTIAAHAVLPTSEVTTATEDAAAPSTSSDSLATSSALRTRWFDGVDAVHQRASNSHQHEASNFLAPERISARSDHALRLLERAWSNYARGRDEFDVMPLSQSTGDDENEAMDLAVAALFAEDSVLPASL